MILSVSFISMAFAGWLAGTMLPLANNSFATLPVGRLSFLAASLSRDRKEGEEEISSSSSQECLYIEEGETSASKQCLSAKEFLGGFLLLCPGMPSDDRGTNLRALFRARKKREFFFPAFFCLLFFNRNRKLYVWVSSEDRRALSKLIYLMEVRKIIYEAFKE